MSIIRSLSTSFSGRVSDCQDGPIGLLQIRDSNGITPQKFLDNRSLTVAVLQPDDPRWRIPRLSQPDEIRVGRHDANPCVAA